MGCCSFSMIWLLTCCSLASFLVSIVAIIRNNPLMISRSPSRSIRQDKRSISAKWIFNLLPIKSSGLSSSPFSSWSYPIKGAILTSSSAARASKSSIFAITLLMFFSRKVSVNLNAWIELSRRLSRLTVINACRLRSRSTCFSRPFPSTKVSKISSYLRKALGKIYVTGA